LVADLSKFLRSSRDPIDADGERRVSARAFSWFRNRAWALSASSAQESALIGIHRKFTANLFGGIFRKFSPG
jgi:hypothetical protein